jgi:hypothetical protein
VFEPNPGEAEGELKNRLKNYERMAHWGAFLFVHFLCAPKENVLGGAGAEQPRVFEMFSKTLQE